MSKGNDHSGTVVMSRRIITVLFEFATLNGGEWSMLTALDWLRRNGTEFNFIAIGPNVGRLADALRAREIPLIGWSQHATSGCRLSPETIEASLFQIIESIRPDLVHANSLAMGRLLGRMAGHLRIPTTAHLRDIIKLSAAAVADLNRIRQLVAVSNATREFHVGQGVDESRVTVVRNGVDLEQFRPRTRTGWLQHELRLCRNMATDSARCNVLLQDVSMQMTKDAQIFPSHQIRESMSGQKPAKLIACIGQIGLRKGQDVLASAAPMIVERVPGANFIFVGERTSQKAESIEFERAISRRFAEAELSDRLHVMGHRDDVAELLSEIDLLVHSANQEPYGRVLLEASAAGVPIVATDVGGTSEIVVDGVTGRLVPHRDPRALADAAIAILTDESEAQRLRDAARQRAMRLFSIEIAAQSLANVWNDVTENGRD